MVIVAVKKFTTETVGYCSC